MDWRDNYQKCQKCKRIIWLWESYEKGYCDSIMCEVKKTVILINIATIVIALLFFSGLLTLCGKGE